MSFNFEAAEKAAATDTKVKPNLAAIVLGESSSGKSYLAGTLPGKTLFLFTQGEEHGKDSAKLDSIGKITPVCIDVDETGKVLGFDAAYKRLLAILSDIDGIRKVGYTNVVVDGLTELEQLVRGTSQWSLECMTKKDGHNNFAEPAATIKLLRVVMDGLRTLQREIPTISYYVTCLLMVTSKGENGEIYASVPKLLGYEVAACLIPQFPDQILVGRMVNPEGVEKHRLQFGAKVGKAVKEKTGEIKKLIGFTPRLRGVSSEDLPDTMAADLSAVLKLKGGK